MLYLTLIIYATNPITIISYPHRLIPTPPLLFLRLESKATFPSILAPLRPQDLLLNHRPDHHRHDKNPRQHQQTRHHATNPADRRRLKSLADGDGRDRERRLREDEAEPRHGELDRMFPADDSQ